MNIFFITQYNNSNRLLKKRNIVSFMNDDLLRTCFYQAILHLNVLNKLSNE